MNFKVYVMTTLFFFSTITFCMQQSDNQHTIYCTKQTLSNNQQPLLIQEEEKKITHYWLGNKSLMHLVGTAFCTMCETIYDMQEQSWRHD